MRTYLGEFSNSDDNLYKYKSDDVICGWITLVWKYFLIAFHGKWTSAVNLIFDVSCLYTDKKKKKVALTVLYKGSNKTWLKSPRPFLWSILLGQIAFPVWTPGESFESIRTVMLSAAMILSLQRNHCFHSFDQFII